MNKKQFVKAVAAESGLTEVDVAKAVAAMQTIIAVCMEHDERIVLPEFGSFHTQLRSARTGRNPRTGAMLKIAAHKVVKFRAGSKLQARVADSSRT